jgi:hypothetical protein
MPGPGDEALPRRVAVPGRDAFEQAPLAIAHDRLPDHRQETAVEFVQRGVGRLQRRTDQVRRDALAAAFELTLMEESQAG